MRIREYDQDSDFAQLRDCVIELQNFERQIDPRLPSGENIVDEYVTQMRFRCRSCDGQILVADIDGDIAGYVTLLNRLQSDELHEGDTEYGLIADLVIREKHRGAGLGRKLMEAAEAAAKTYGVRWLRVSVMSANAAARKLYSSAGFSELYAEFEKDLGDETD
jgi:GNAT superfamily N-acetyltransferase